MTPITTTDPSDGSEDVNDFLLRIRELGEKRDKEDEERTKKLEEEILQGRKERQARRAERAQSISPTKDSPLSERLNLALGHRANDSPGQLEPSSQPSEPDTTTTTTPSRPINDEASPTAEDKSGVSHADATEMKPSPPQTPSTSTVGRSGTLSWQQRPSSRDLNTTNKPVFSNFSRVGGAKATSTTSNDDQEPSRSQIARSLSSKDPSWFRQTPDRGVGSPALRKDTEVTGSGVAFLNKNQRLPGMGRESTTDPEKPISQDVGEERSPTPSRASSTFGDSSLGNRYSSISSASALGSPVPVLSSQKFEARKSEPVLEDQLLASPTQRRLSPERSTSPTKGLGGFVQSAMMKRSDSVSKRWSAQASPRHSRANSVASNRNSIAISTLGDLPNTAIGWKPTHESSPSMTSRPGSSHSEATVVHNTKESERPATPPAPVSSNVRPDLSLATQERPTSALRKDEQDTEPKPQTPTSPFVSRTMDPKRWSPTKATWLESVLNRPESPRQNKQPQQPSWVRDRQARGSVDLGRSNSFKEVTPVGLMRSPAPGSHYKTPSLSGIPGMVGTADTSKVKEPASDPSPSAKGSDPAPVENTTDVSPAPTEVEPHKETNPDSPLDDAPKGKRPPPLVTPKPNITLPALSPRDPISPRPKAQSPVVDFRANLRRREIVKDASSSPKEEPEFKNVFGKLRKAEATTYVPQNELKENILKGKAALTAAGGPKKSPRVDEFKESILKQKQVIRTSGGSLRRNTVGENDDPAKPVIPEAIAKRNNLSKASSVKVNRPAGGLSSPSPEEIKTQLTMPGNQPPSSKGSEDVASPATPDTPTTPAMPSADKHDARDFEFNNAAPVSPDDKANNKGRDDNLTSQPKEEGTEAKQQDSVEKVIKPVRALPSGNAAHVADAANATEGLVTKGKLAGRINPALAGLLSRGPPVAGAGPGTPPLTSISRETSSITPSQPRESQSAASLTHMTKNRARGPKRRLPKATANESTLPTRKNAPGSSSSRATPSVEIKTSRLGSSTNNASTPSLPGTQTGPTRAEETSHVLSKPKIASKPAELGKSLQGSQKDEPDKKPGSFSASKINHNKSPSPQPDRRGDENVKDAALFSKPALRPKPVKSSSVPVPKQSPQASTETEPERNLKSVSSRLNLDLDKFHSRRVASPPRDVEDKSAVTPSSKPALPPKPSKSPSPSPLSVQKQRLQPSSSPSPLQTSLKENRMDSPSNAQQEPPHGFEKSGPRRVSSQNKTLPSPPVPPKKSGISVDQPTNPPKPPPKTSSLSLIPQTGEAVKILSTFFKTFPKSSDRVDIDPQLILENRTQDLKIRTLRRQIWEITGDGKRQDLPVNQEYILFEGSMYLCVHLFEGDGGPRSEVHLWCGDEVGEAAFEDAQLFARKVARENGCKLELIKQGKETGRFIQALGGIIITRRGSSSRSSSSALYMLCGRRHLKQMVFDEVDFSRRNLCSGYPFVISARFGKLYLWKGKGSGAEEIGAARLIGMDLGLTGDFEEVAEGKEPEGFFEVFPDYKDTEDYMRSDYWRLKPRHDHFHHRLLRFDHELGQRSGFWIRRTGSSSPVIRPNDTVQEIQPFCQKDLTMKDIYVLDAFFEIYVIVGEQAWNRPGEFASAVVFAQEYGILAASLQDRPFIPKSFVSIGGIPDACQSAFRKWDKRPWQTVPRLLPLNAAIEAIRS